MTHAPIALEYIETHFEDTLNDLCHLVTIPSISSSAEHTAQVLHSAQEVARLMTESGLENIEILSVSGAHPYVYGEWCHQPHAPTLLLYAHHDVQPVGREKLWKTKPFEPTKRNGPGGERLYGRGTADDKAGILVHLAAIKAYLQTSQKLPVNVKVLIEGEEEIGSPHLYDFLNTFKDKVKADVMVLTDTANYDCGIPSLTVSLRGLAAVEVELRALDKTVHSGFWSGLVPDSAGALCKILSTLVDAKGAIIIPGIEKLIPELSDNEIRDLKKIPFDENEFRKQSGMIASADVLSHKKPELIQLWRYPSLTVNGLQSSSRDQPGNVLNDVAWAKLSIRLAPGMDPQKTLKLLKDHLLAHVPWGLDLKFLKEEASSGWLTNPYEEKQAPYFEAARRSLKSGYGKEAFYIGCGATIPFVKPFASALDNAPAILIGVEDPYTDAHGENESLLISDFKKACLAQVHLFDEFAKLTK